MDSVRLLNWVFVAAATAALASDCCAQTREVSPNLPYPVKPVPSDSTIPYPAKPLPRVKTLSPFAGNSSAANEPLIAYSPEGQMNADDRSFAGKMLPAIRDAAKFAGIEFDEAKWSYRQLACQAIPNHLFLLFEANGGTGNASLFSASIPRGGKGHLRIIPVERRGFTLFSPAPVNTLAIAAFNRIRAEEPKGPPADWLSTSLCYAALTEPRRQVTLLPRRTHDGNLALSFPPRLEIGREGESTVRFVDVARQSQPMQWALTFDAKDQLVKVMHFPAPVYVTKVLPKN